MARPFIDAILKARPDLAQALQAGSFAGVNPTLADRAQDFIQDTPGVALSSGFRSTAKQAQLYADRANNPNPVARPGTSKHETGDAVDFSGITPHLQRVAQAYGLYFPHRNDPVHAELATTGYPDAGTSPVQIASASRAAPVASTPPAQQPQQASSLGLLSQPAPTQPEQQQDPLAGLLALAAQQAKQQQPAQQQSPFIDTPAYRAQQRLAALQFQPSKVAF